MQGIDFRFLLLTVALSAIGLTSATAAGDFFKYGDDIEGNIETVGPIGFGSGEVEAAVMYKMTSPYIDDEPLLRRAEQVVCEVWGDKIVKDVQAVRPGDYSLLIVIFKWVGAEVNGVAPTKNYTSVFNLKDCSHIGKNK